MDIRILDFKTEYRTGKPPRDWVIFTSADGIKGDGNYSHTTSEPVECLRPKDGVDGMRGDHIRAVWAIIEPAYKAWKDGAEAPEVGTALGAWPGVTPEQAKALRSIGIRSVEEMASVSESVMARSPVPNMRDLKAQAQLWLDGRDGAEQAAKITELQAQLEAMKELLVEAAAERQDTEEAKPRRGRPPKVKQDEAA
jgi:hypothetical protein